MEKFGLPGERLLIGAEHLAFLGAKFFGGEALGVHHGLLADVIRRDGSQVGLGDLNGVTEGAIVADLQRLDASAVLFVALEIRDPALAVRSERAKAVELRVEAGAQGSPFGQVDREFVAKGGFQTSQQRRFGLDARGQRRKGTSGQGLQLFAQRRQRTQRIADAAEFAGIAQTILESGEDAGEVADAAQGFGDARSRTGVTDEFADGGLTTADQSEVSGRLREPQSQQTSPRGGLRPVDGLQQ